MTGLVREAMRPEPARRHAVVVTPEQTAPDPRAAAHVAAARQALAHGDAHDCAESAADALARDPRNLFAAFYLGQARLRQGRYAEARTAFEAARGAGDPFGLVAGWLRRLDDLEATAQAHPEPHVAAAIELERAARSAMRAAQWERAAGLADEAVTTDPGNLLAHHLLGRALLASGRRADALAAFDRARAHDHGLGLVDAWIEGADRPVDPAEFADDTDDAAEPDDR